MVGNGATGKFRRSAPRGRKRLPAGERAFDPNPAFGERFEVLARLVAGVLGRDTSAMATDVGGVGLAVTFEDGTREERELWLPASEFHELIAVVRGMLLPLEEAPRVLR